MQYHVRSIAALHVCYNSNYLLITWTYFNWPTKRKLNEAYRKLFNNYEPTSYVADDCSDLPFA